MSGRLYVPRPSQELRGSSFLAVSQCRRPCDAAKNELQHMCPKVEQMLKNSLFQAGPVIDI